MREHDDSNKRKYPRKDVEYLVSYRAEEPSEHYDLSQTKNVSQGGMLLMTSRMFEKNIPMEMMITFPLIPQRIKIAGRVVGCKEIVKNSIYETRIEYVNLDEEFFKKLGRFIEENLK